MKRVKSSRSSRIGSDLREINIFVGLTLIIFFVAIGFPTLINTSPSLGYEGIDFTPVATYYQQAYAQQETFDILSNYYYNPMVSSAYLVLPTTLDNLPPPDPLQYFELKYNQGVDIEFEFIEYEQFRELLTPNLEKLDFLPPIKQEIKKILEYQILPQAFADHGASHTYPDPVLYLDFEDQNLNSELITNLGTFGSPANCVLKHETTGNFSTTVIKNSTGLIGNSLIINGSSTIGTEIRCGLDNLSNKDSLWRFLHTADNDPAGFGANLTSINLWVLGDFNVGTSANRKHIVSTTASNDGFVFMARDPDELVGKVSERNQNEVFNIGTASQKIPNDGAWHMITMLVNKTQQSTNVMRLCLDSTICTNHPYLSSPRFDGDGTGTFSRFTIGENDGTSVFAPDFNVDEVAVWKNHFLNSTEIDFLFNGGVGNRVLSVVSTNQTISDVVVVVDQVTVKKQFVAIDNLEVYWKFDHITPTFVSEFINSTDWNVTGTEITPTNSSTSGHLEVRQENNQDGIHGIAHDLGSPASDTSWVLRFPIENIKTVTTSGNSLITTIGITDRNETVSVNVPPAVSDSIGIAVQFDTVGQEVEMFTVWSDEAIMRTNGAFLPSAPNDFGTDPRYVEIIRNSATSVTWNIYNDTGFTQLWLTDTRVIPSTVDVMNFIKFGTDSIGAPNVGDFDYNVDNIKFWNATTDIHAELHTEDFANINDADQLSDNAIVNKTEIGIIGNAWQTSPTNDQTNVTIGGVKTDWNFVVNSDTTYNFWTTQADPVVGSDQGFLFGTINQTAPPDIGASIVLDYGFADDQIIYRVRNSTDDFFQAITPVGELDRLCRPDCTAFTMYTVTKNTTSLEVKWYTNGTLVETDAVAEVTLVGEDVELLPTLFTRAGVGLSSLNDAIVDEFSIWSRALNDTEVSTLYNDGFGLELNNFAQQQQLAVITNVTNTDTATVSDQVTTIQFDDLDIEVWQLREHDIVLLSNDLEVNVFTNTTDNSLAIQHVGTTGRFSMFKVFENSTIDGQTIAITWKSFLGNDDFKPSVSLLDGSYDRTNSTDFPEDSAPPLKGGGSLTNCASQSPPVPNTPISLSTYECVYSTTGSTEGNVTVFINYDTNVGTNELDIHQINITGIGIWNYTQSHIIDYIATPPPPDGDFGLVQSNFTSIGLFDVTITDTATVSDQTDITSVFNQTATDTATVSDQVITDLITVIPAPTNVTAIQNGTDIKLNWIKEGTADGYKILRKATNDTTSKVKGEDLPNDYLKLDDKPVGDVELAGNREAGTVIINDAICGGAQPCGRAQNFTMGNQDFTLDKIRLKIIGTTWTTGNALLKVAVFNGSSASLNEILENSTDIFTSTIGSNPFPSGQFHDFQFDDFVLLANKTYMVGAFTNGSSIGGSIQMFRDDTVFGFTSYATNFDNGELVFENGGDLTAWSRFNQMNLQIDLIGDQFEEIATLGDVDTFTDVLSSEDEGNLFFYKVQSLIGSTEGNVSSIVNQTAPLISGSDLFNSTSKIWQFREHDLELSNLEGASGAGCLTNCGSGGLFPNANVTIGAQEGRTTATNGQPLPSDLLNINTGLSATGGDSESNDRGNGIIHFFKIFNTTEITDSSITIAWQQEANGGSSDVGLNSVATLAVYDGIINKDSGFNFAHDIPVLSNVDGVRTGLSGSTLSGIEGASVGAGVGDFNMTIQTLSASSINWGSFNSSFATVVVSMRDPDSRPVGSNSGAYELFIANITVSKIGTWNFTNPQIIYTVDGNRQLAVDVCPRRCMDLAKGFIGERGFVNTTSFALPPSIITITDTSTVSDEVSTELFSVPDQVTGLTVIQNMTNNAELDWDDANGADNYQVFRTNATGFEIQEWELKEQDLYRGSSPRNEPDYKVLYEVPFNAFPIHNFIDTRNSTENLLVIKSGAGNVRQERGDFYVFKVFDKADLPTTGNITVTWGAYEEYLACGGVFPNPCGFGGGVPRQPTFDIRDGSYDRFNVTDFPSNPSTVFGTGAGVPTKGSGIFGSVSGGRPQHFETQPSGGAYIHTNTTSYDLSSSVLDQVTIMVRTDDNDVSFAPTTVLESVEIENFGIWNFERGSGTNGTGDGILNYTAQLQSDGLGLMDDGSMIAQFTCTKTVGTCDFGALVSLQGTGQVNAILIGSPVLSEFTDTTISPLTNVLNYTVRGNNTQGFGANSTAVEFGLIQPIANLNATALNSTTIQLTWDLAQTVHPSDPLTGVRIERAENGTAVWEYREHDRTGATREACYTDIEGILASLPRATNQLGNGFHVAERGSGAGSCGQETGDFFIMKSFPFDEINGSSITVTNWRGGQQANGIRLNVFDGNYTAGNNTLFPLASDFIFIGGGQLGSVLEPTTNSFVNTTLPASSIDYSSSTEGVITVLVRLRDSSISVSQFLDINQLYISNLGTYDFSKGTVNGTNTVANQNDLGTITILHNNFTSSTTSTFGTILNFTEIATVDELVTSFNDTGLPEGTTFFYRAKGVSAVSTGAFDQIVNATTLIIIPNVTATDIATVIDNEDFIINKTIRNVEILTGGTTFNDDFTSYPDNATADLTWEHSVGGCTGGGGGGATCGVNATADHVLYDGRVDPSTGISYDLFANLGINATDSTGAGNWTLLWEGTMEFGSGWTSGSGQTRISFSIADRDFGTGRGSSHDAIGFMWGERVGVFADNNMFGILSDGETHITGTAGVGGNGTRGIIDNRGNTFFFNVTHTFNGTESTTFFEAHRCPARDSTCVEVAPFNRTQAGERYTDLRFIKILGNGNNGNLMAFSFDNVTFIKEGTRTLITGDLIQVTDIVNATKLVKIFNQTETDTVTVSDQTNLNVTKLLTDISLAVDEISLTITKLLSDTTTTSDAEITTFNPIPNEIDDLSAFAVADTCELTWSSPFNLGDPFAPINGYKILRSIAGGSFNVLVANTSSTLTAFNDTGLVLNADHDYDVRALNKHGEASGSNIDTCVPQPSSPPNSPTLLIATAVGTDVQLDWTASTQGSPSGYFIERKIDGGGFIDLVLDTGSTSTTFVDQTVIPATKFFYRVSAINAFGVSAPSNDASVTTLETPNKPTLFAVQNVNQIDLTWTEPTSDEPINGYRVEKRINLGLFFDLVSNTTNTNLTLTDDNVTAGNTFGYRVRALSSIGTGDVSNVVDVNFGSHVIVEVREQDGTSYKGGGSVIMANSTFSTTQIINGQSNAEFDNFEVGNFNFTFVDLDDFILNRTINFPFPSGNLTSTFEIRALVFDVDCPSNGGGTDVRIKVNYTDLHDITQFPSAPVCDSSDKVSWSTTWGGSQFSANSTMIADFISVNFLSNADQFLVSTVPTGTSYDSVANRITSESYGIIPQIPLTNQTINFDLFLGQSPPQGGGGGGGTPAPFIPSITPRPEDLELTGLSLLSRTHQFAMAGDVIRGFIDIQWEGEDPLTITRITIGDFTGSMVFLDTPRFDIPQSIEGSGEFAMSSGSIPYVITLPPQDCQPEIGLDQNCLIRELFAIPVEFEFEFKGQAVTGSTNVMVDARPIPFDIVQLQVILLGIVLIGSALAGNFIRMRLKKQRKPASKKRRKFKKKFDSS